MRPEDTRQDRLEYLLKYAETLNEENPYIMLQKVVEEAIREYGVADRTAKNYGKTVLLKLGVKWVSLSTQLSIIY